VALLALRFDDQDLKRRLVALSVVRQTAFGLITCERMFPALRSFGEDTGFDISTYQRCLDVGWNSLDHGDSNHFSERAKTCFDNAPDTERFSHPLTSAALNSALSIALLMGFLADRNTDHIVELARLAFDTAFLRAQEPGYGLRFATGSAGITAHPIVQQELRRQAEDLLFVNGLPENAGLEIVPLTRARIRSTAGMVPD